MGGLVDGLFGGAPDAPDPYKTAEAQGAMNAETARLTATLNRANQYTPFGSQTWSQGGSWDQAGYDAAMEAWRAAVGQTQPVANPNPMSQDELMHELLFGPLAGRSRSDSVQMYNNSRMLSPSIREPTREEFGYNPDLWSSRIELDPRLQSLLDSNIELQQGMVGAQQGALGNVNQLFSSPMPQMAGGRFDGLLDLTNQRLSDLYSQDFNYNSLGAMPVADEALRQRIENALYERMTGRLDPMYAQRESDLNSRLAAQGITQGSDAYGSEWGILGRDRNDAYANAMLDSILAGGQEMQRQFGMDMAARQQGMQELNFMRMLPSQEASVAAQLAQLDLGLRQGEYSAELQNRNQALNELAALMSGTQVQLPQFGNAASGASVAPVDLASLISQNYNAEMGAYNSGQQGLGMLGSSLLSAAGQAGGFGALFAGL